MVLIRHWWHYLCQIWSNLSPHLTFPVSSNEQSWWRFFLKYFFTWSLNTSNSDPLSLLIFKVSYWYLKLRDFWAREYYKLQLSSSLFSLTAWLITSNIMAINNLSTLCILTQPFLWILDSYVSLSIYIPTWMSNEQT